MTAAAPIIRERLHNQRLTATTFRSAADVVAWLTAVQSQDYSGAKWALSLRAVGLVDDDVDRAFDEGKILRTHILRPTWHFLAPADIRWMLALSGPRVHAGNAVYYRKFELDRRVLSRSRRVLERVLANRTFLTRTEIAERLARSGIEAAGQRLAYLVMHAELDGVICSGPRRGKQFTYALLDERVPRAPARPREEALAELTTRYFSSHGPATIKDFSWWSGLTMRDAKMGVELASRSLVGRDVARWRYWSVPSPSSSTSRLSRTMTWLLPNYDEFLIAYRDRDLFLSPTGRTRLMAPGVVPFPHHVIGAGRLTGAWRTIGRGSTAVVDIDLYQPPARGDLAALGRAVERYGRFLRRPATLALKSPKSGAL